MIARRRQAALVFQKTHKRLHAVADAGFRERVTAAIVAPVAPSWLYVSAIRRA
jgi:hypothetical protein